MEKNVFIEIENGRVAKVMSEDKNNLFFISYKEGNKREINMFGWPDTQFDDEYFKKNSGKDGSHEN